MIPPLRMAAVGVRLLAVLSISTVVAGCATPATSARLDDRRQESLSRSQHDEESFASRSPWQRQREEQDQQWHSEHARARR